MKRYMLFAVDTYYPRGGMNDFHSSYDEIEEAKHEGDKLIEKKYDWYQIFDIENPTFIIYKNWNDTFKKIELIEAKESIYPNVIANNRQKNIISFKIIDNDSLLNNRK